MTLGAEQRGRLDIFRAMLLDRNRALNLTAITDPHEVWVRHFEDSLAAVPLLRRMTTACGRMTSPSASGSPERRATDGGSGAVRRDSPRLIDVGSGAGFPGLVLAIALPEWEVTSIEATGKKARFQEEVIAELGLPNARVIHERAERVARDPAHRERYDVATARAVAPLATLAEITLPFVRIGGCVIAWKGRGAGDEAAASRAALEKLGGRLQAEVPYSLSGFAERPETAAAPSSLRLLALRKSKATPIRYPRRPGIPRKRPLR